MVIQQTLDILNAQLKNFEKHCKKLLVRTSLIYLIILGMQGLPISGGENIFIPDDMLTLPESLKILNYATHLVGKWHLGAANKNHTPTARGFDTHFGYWNGYVGYFNQVLEETINSTTVNFPEHNLFMNEQSRNYFMCHFKNV